MLRVGKDAAKEPEMLEYLANWNGYSRSLGIIPTDTDIVSEATLRNLGVYDPKLTEFQLGVASAVEETIQGLPLPGIFTKDWLIAEYVKAASEYLRRRPEVAKSLKYAAFREKSGQCLRNLKTVTADYMQILSLMEKQDVDFFFRSDLPPTYFNDSILAYRTVSSFLEARYQGVADFVNHKLVLYRSNERKLERALDSMKKAVEHEMESLTQLLLHQGKLRLYVLAWNAEKAEELFRPKELSFEKLSRDSYEELNRLFKVNLSLFTRSSPVPVKKIDPFVDTMWRGLIEPLVIQS
jgi:hypothetical protein